MFAYQRKKVGLALALTDIALVSIAFLLAYQTRFNLSLEREFYIPGNRNFVLWLATVVAWLAIAVSSRIYEHLDSAHWARIIRSTIRQCILGMACVVLFEYFNRWDISRVFLLFLFLYSLLFLTVFRLNSKRLVRLFLQEFGSPYHVLLVGPVQQATELGELLTQASPFRLKLVGVLTDEECKLRLPRLLSSQVVDEVIFRVSSDKLSNLEEVFLLCDEEGIRTRVATDFLSAREQPHDARPFRPGAPSDLFRRARR